MNPFFRKLIYHVGYLLYYKSQYTKLIKEYNYIKKNIYKSINNNKEIQKNKLFNLIKFAIENIPYYKEIAEERNIIVTKDTIFEDIKKFPILTKDLIRKNWKSLHGDLKNSKYIINTSGGTTGETTKIIQDLKYRISGEVSTIIFDEIGGYKIGDKLIRLWGNEKDYFYLSKGLKRRLKNRYIKNTLFLNSFKMSISDMTNYINKINQFKPKSIIAYMQSILELAKFIKINNLKINPINSIISSAAVLTEDAKNIIEDVFKCKVFNRYASRETGMIATSCEKQNKLHINMYHQYVEILDDENRSLEEHQRGNIVITNLINYSMPLIRFKIGDRGSFDFSKCPCGRGLINLDNIYGRIVDVFKTKDGTLVDGEYITRIFYYTKNLKQFQAIQVKYDEINIFLVTLNNRSLSNVVEKDIEEKIKIVMGKNCKINLNYVSEIEPSISGKIRYTISKI